MKTLYQITLAVLTVLAANTSSAEQSCNSNLKVTTPSSRFELNGGEARDTQTGLIWKRCLVGQTWNINTEQCDGSLRNYSWKGALKAASGNWRVPNIKELGSIVEHACERPSANLNIFLKIPSGPLWSSTPSLRRSTSRVEEATEVTIGWAVRVTNFQYGFSTSRGKQESFPVLLVRDDT